MILLVLFQANYSHQMFKDAGLPLEEEPFPPTGDYWEERRFSLKDAFWQHSRGDKGDYEKKTTSDGERRRKIKTCWIIQRSRGHWFRLDERNQRIVLNEKKLRETIKRKPMLTGCGSRGLKRPELVALGLVVITFLLQPQRRHRGTWRLDKTTTDSKRHVVKTQRIQPLRTWTWAEDSPRWRGASTRNETAAVKRRGRRGGHTAARRTQRQEKATANGCCKTAKPFRFGFKKKNAFLKCTAFLCLQCISRAAIVMFWINLLSTYLIRLKGRERARRYFAQTLNLSWAEPFFKVLQ